MSISYIVVTYRSVTRRQAKELTKSISNTRNTLNYPYSINIPDLLDIFTKQSVDIVFNSRYRDILKFNSNNYTIIYRELLGTFIILKLLTYINRLVIIALRPNAIV